MPNTKELIEERIEQEIIWLSSMCNSLDIDEKDLRNIAVALIDKYIEGEQALSKSNKEIEELIQDIELEKGLKEDYLEEIEKLKDITKPKCSISTGICTGKFCGCIRQYDDMKSQLKELQAKNNYKKK